MAEQSSGLCIYLRDNADILTVENLNALDALVFAVLCSFKFEDVFTGQDWEFTIPVGTFAEVMLQHGRACNTWYMNEEIHLLQDKQTCHRLSRDEADFLEGLMYSQRYRSSAITGMKAENDLAQWAAFTVEFGDSGAVFIAMRGTDGTILGWTEDLLLTYDDDGTEAQKRSAEYIDHCTAPMMILTGHSKGGNDVVSGYCMASESARNRVLQIYNFDGPGVNREFRERFRVGYDELHDKLRSYYPQDPIIGKLLNNHPGREYYVQSNVREAYEGKGIFGEHDPFSWEVRGNDLVETKQSDFSKWLDESLDDTLSKLSNEERKNVVEVFLKYGVPSLIIGSAENAFADNKRAAMEAVDYIDKYGVMPKEMREKITKTAVKPFFDLHDAAHVWQQLTTEEKRAAEKVAVLFLLYGAYRS